MSRIPKSFGLFAVALSLALTTAGYGAQAAHSPDALQRAAAELVRHDDAAAERTLRTLIQREPANAGAWTLMGVVRAEQQRPAEAETFFRKALEIDPHLVAAETNLGHLLLEQHREAEALPYLQDALVSDGGNSQLRDMMVGATEAVALRQRAAGDRSGALATLLAAKAEASHSFPLLLDLSIVEDELRLYRDADCDVHEALGLQPGDPKALYAEARVKMDLQDMPAAEQAMRAYLKLRPDDATAHYGLGRILQITQRSADAKAEFERSIELAPNQAESYYQIGQMALDNGELTEAQQQCRKALEHDPKHGGALAANGIAAFRLKQYPQAIQSLQAAITVAPDYQPAHYYYGLALARTGQKDASEQELKLATQLADEQNRKDARRLQLAPAGQDALHQP